MISISANVTSRLL